MENNTEKHKWIDEVLDSTTGMRKASPGEVLYENIMLKLNRPAPIKTVRLPIRQWVAAAILLLGVNVGSVIYYNNLPAKTTGVAFANPIALEMQSTLTYNY